METRSGIIVLNKDEGMTSQSAVSRVRRLFGARKAGHSGTLDPMATGVLPVLLGGATVAAEYLVSGQKHYIATLRLGMTSDTEDVTGAIINRCTGPLPSADAVCAAAEKFLGDSPQIPPMYSALKVGGQKLCDLARRGITVERKPRTVEISSLCVTDTENVTDYILDVACSSGTYIRTLCADIGQKLGCGGVMSSLCRTEAGGFSIENSVTIAELEEMSEEQRVGILVPTEALFDSLPKVTPAEFYEKLCRNGCEIYQKKIGTDLPLGTKVALFGKNGFFALGEVRDYPEGSAVKAVKLFDL